MNVNIQNDEEHKSKHVGSNKIWCLLQKKEVLNKNVCSSSTQCVPPWIHEVPMNAEKVVE
jgi:hypothetical protein